MDNNKLPYSGLSDDEIEERINNEQVNNYDDRSSKTIKQIYKENIFTFFNGINIALLIIVLSVNSLRNTTFIFIIVINTINGIYNELKAKKTLDKLKVLTSLKANVVRNNDLQTISIKDIVLDDVIVLVTGDQVPTDCVLLEGHLEANESLLTGESNAILKVPNDNLLSGSFITSGRGFCKVTHVGADNYINKLSVEAKKHTEYNSQLRNSLNQILKIISIILIPIGILLFLKQYFYSGSTYTSAVVSTVASLVGMIPEGLVLLTSLALTLSVMRLAKKNTLVQELYCIETLARVDCLCLDKTGTLTKGEMEVVEDIKLTDTNFDNIVANMYDTLQDTNVTSTALCSYFKVQEKLEPIHSIPFSSQRKYASVSFMNYGSYYLGAYQFVLPNGDKSIEESVEKYTSQGYRVLVLCHSLEIPKENELVSDLKAIGLIVLSDVLRDGVNKTLSFLTNQGVSLKVISGDDPATVSTIASKAGVNNASKYIDVSKINTDEELEEAVINNTVFGRVSPDQKRQMIKMLKKNDMTVAMTGDGVNDVLAFKSSDCSIAMASGSDAAKNSANIVLLDNDFNSIPSILNEGRMVINNITRSSSMYLVKTIFSVIISILTIIFGHVYPFVPIQLTVISAFCVGIPTFFLTYEKDYSKIKKVFFNEVLRYSFPAALTISLFSVILLNVGLMLGINKEILTTLCLIIASSNYLLAILKVYYPLNNYRKFIIFGCHIILYVSIIIFHNFFYLHLSFPFSYIMIPVLIITSVFMYKFNEKLYLKVKRLYLKFKDAREF
ncbi:MAG: HAD-IC family P-type ATPase [Thomasclavelia sp.]|nr:HAD-IC family P-type ATPase [Thomasclavelia sp.]